jgi:hypothetical protein
MTSPFLRLALAAAALQATFPLVARAGDGYTATLIDQPTQTSPGATPETVKAYTFITSRTRHTGSNMIEGQHLGGPNDFGKPVDVFDMQNYRIPSTAMAGLSAYPRLVGARYDNNALDAHSQATLDSASIAQIGLKLEAIANTYHPLIAITATPLNPWDTSRSLDRQPLPNNGDGPLSDLAYSKRTSLTGTDTPANRFWGDIDKIATGLANLKGQAAHDFVALWSDVVTYYRDIKGLHNLIYCWEAWTWGSSSTASPSQTFLDRWFPVGQVDVVGGAFYFTQQNKADGYFNLVFGPAGAPSPQNADDQAIFNDLMSLAVNNNLPFGATQWAVDQKYPKDVYGDNLDTLAFMTALDKLHGDPSATAQHMAFDYNWSTSQEANMQAHADLLVDDPRVATVSSIDGVPGKQGAILESAPGSGVGGGQPNGVLETGFTSAGNQYRTILSFPTGMLPGNATLDPDNKLTLLMAPLLPDAATTPFDVAGQKHCLDAAYLGGSPAEFGGSVNLVTGDFSAPGANCVATSSDWRTNATTARAPAGFSVAWLDRGYLNRSAPTQLRAYFTTPGGQVVWQGTPTTAINAGDDWAPQLVFSYLLP